jgi:hypothetical protein
VFTGWSGAGCSGTGGCTVTIGAEQTVTATFDPASPVQHVLTVSRSGSGSGTVTSAPPGIDCGATCSASFKNGSQVTLTATPAAGSTFAGWTVSGCSGTDACVVTMSSDQTITATFTPARSTAPPKCVGVVKSSSVLLSPTQSHGQRGSKQAAGTLALRVTCDQSATVNLSGKLIERGKQRSMTFSLRNRTASVSSGVAATLTVSLPPGAVAALRRGAYESVAVSLIVSNANGTSRLKTIISRPRLRH